MARVNPVVELLQRENGFLRTQIQKMRENPGDIPFLACDHSCVCATATGMATNGGCRCDEQKLRCAVQYWRRLAEFRQITIQSMRDGVVLDEQREPTGTVKIGPPLEFDAHGAFDDGDEKP